MADPSPKDNNSTQEEKYFVSFCLMEGGLGFGHGCLVLSKAPTNGQGEVDPDSPVQALGAYGFYSVADSAIGKAIGFDPVSVGTFKKESLRYFEKAGVNSHITFEISKEQKEKLERMVAQRQHFYNKQIENYRRLNNLNDLSDDQIRKRIQKELDELKAIEISYLEAQQSLSEKNPPSKEQVERVKKSAQRYQQLHRQQMQSDKYTFTRNNCVHQAVEMMGEFLTPEQRRELDKISWKERKSSKEKKMDALDLVAVHGSKKRFMSYKTVRKFFLFGKKKTQKKEVSYHKWQTSADDIRKARIKFAQNESSDAYSALDSSAYVTLLKKHKVLNIDELLQTYFLDEAMMDRFAEVEHKLKLNEDVDQSKLSEYQAYIQHHRVDNMDAFYEKHDFNPLQIARAKKCEKAIPTNEQLVEQDYLHREAQAYWTSPLTYFKKDGQQVRYDKELENYHVNLIRDRQAWLLQVKTKYSAIAKAANISESDQIRHLNELEMLELDLARAKMNPSRLKGVQEKIIGVCESISDSMTEVARSQSEHPENYPAIILIDNDEKKELQASIQSLSVDILLTEKAQDDSRQLQSLREIQALRRKLEASVKLSGPQKKSTTHFYSHSKVRDRKSWDKQLNFIRQLETAFAHDQNMTLEMAKASIPQREREEFESLMEVRGRFGGTKKTSLAKMLTKVEAIQTPPSVKPSQPQRRNRGR